MIKSSDIRNITEWIEQIQQITVGASQTHGDRSGALETINAYACAIHMVLLEVQQTVDVQNSLDET